MKLGVTTTLLPLVLAGCLTSWVPGQSRVSGYVSSDGSLWSVNVVSVWKLQTVCGPLTYGCIIGKGRGGLVYIPDSAGAAWHECSHIKALADGSTPTREWLKDIAGGWLLGSIASVAPIPAGDKPCGESPVYGVDSDRGGRLMTLEEWKRNGG